MQYITVTYCFKDTGELREFIISQTAFGLPKDESTLRKLADVTLKSLDNKEADEITKDLLNELNIPTDDME